MVGSATHCKRVARYVACALFGAAAMTLIAIAPTAEGHAARPAAITTSHR